MEAPNEHTGRATLVARAAIFWILCVIMLGSAPARAAEPAVSDSTTSGSADAESTSVGIASETVPPATASVEPPTILRVKKPSTFTLRGRPYPETKWFAVLQAGVIMMPGHDADARRSQPAGTTDPPYVTYSDNNPVHGFADVGAMRNLGTRWAVGANLHAEEDAIGFMVRGRRWLGRSFSFDLATGYLDTRDRIPSAGGNKPSWINQAQLNCFNVLTITAQTDTWRYEQEEIQLGETTRVVESGTNFYWGAGLQYVPGVVGTILAGIIVVSLFAMPPT